MECRSTEEGVSKTNYDHSPGNLHVKATNQNKAVLKDMFPQEKIQ